MKSVIALLRYCVIVFSVVFLCSYAFAGQVQLEGIVARIPSARILDWEGDGPTVDGDVAWQEQALSEGNEVCCDGGCEYTDIALNRSADNVVRLSGGCLTIADIEGESVVYTGQESGEALFGLEVLSDPSGFTVETPDATIGVTGTVFAVIVDPVVHSTRVGISEVKGTHSIDITDKTDDLSWGLPSDPDENDSYQVLLDEEVTINSGDYNIGPVPLSDAGWNIPPGIWKQTGGEIARKSRGKKKGIYKHEEEGDDDYDYYHHGHHHHEDD